MGKSVTWSFRQATVGVITQKSKVMEHVVCSRALYTVWKKLLVYYGSDGSLAIRYRLNITGAVPHELVLSDTQ